MARVRVMMMQRDETLLIDAWLRCYGYLFGFESLVVFDNGSSDAGVVATLRRAEQAGVDVRWRHREASDFVNKGAHFRNVMLHWRDTGAEYDFALPVDCDAFPAVFTRTGLECGRDAIHAAFDALRGERRALRVRTTLSNIPDWPNRFLLEEYGKTFLPAHAAGTIDHGFHDARSELEEGRRETDLTFLHFVHKPFRAFKQAARARLAAFAGTEEDDLLRDHSGVGAELVPMLRLTDAAYRANFAERWAIEYPAFGHLLGALGVESALLGAPVAAPRDAAPDQVGFVDAAGERRWFDGRAYLERNRDVAETDWPAILHYAEMGMHEARDIG